MKLPDFEYEERLWRRGFKIVAGADEVGRGSLAGPLIAAAVVFSADAPASCSTLRGSDPWGPGLAEAKINDSKKLTAKQREKADKWIRENCYVWGIGEVSVSEINRLGMAKASKMVFRRAVKIANGKLQVANSGSVEFLLVDAFYIPYTRGIKRKNQLAIVKGDTKSFSIASASIVAKVYRDKLMRGLSRKHRKYAWDKNAGYGTKEHSEAIKKYGPTRHHRKAFIRKCLST